MTAPAWEKVSAKDFLRDVERANSEAYKLQGHNFQARKRIPWLVCKSCGLIRLRNTFTGWCDRMGCLYRQHSDFPRMRIGKIVFR